MSLPKEAPAILRVLVQERNLWRTGVEIAKLVGVRSPRVFRALTKLIEEGYVMDEFRKRRDHPGLEQRHYRITPAGIDYLLDLMGKR